MTDRQQDAAGIRQFEPLSIGGILDRTINLYVHNFMLFFGITLIPYGLNYANSIILAKSFQWSNRAATAAYVLAYIVVYLLSTAIGTGAATVAISSRYLGRETSVAAAYRRAMPYLGSIMRAWIIAVILIALVYLGVVTGLTIVLGIASAIFSDLSVFLGILSLSLMILGSVLLGGRMVASYSLITPVLILENCSARQSRKRSRLLTKQARWQILGILFLYFIALMLVSCGTTILVNLISGKEQSALLSGELSYIHYLVNAPLHFLSAPISAILVVLIYYNQRIRKEGFDLVLLAEALASD